MSNLLIKFLHLVIIIYFERQKQVYLVPTIHKKMELIVLEVFAFDYVVHLLLFQLDVIVANLSLLERSESKEVLGFQMGLKHLKRNNEDGFLLVGWTYKALVAKSKSWDTHLISLRCTSVSHRTYEAWCWYWLDSLCESSMMCSGEYVGSFSRLASKACCWVSQRLELNKYTWLLLYGHRTLSISSTCRTYRKSTYIQK